MSLSTAGYAISETMAENPKKGEETPITNLLVIAKFRHSTYAVVRLRLDLRGFVDLWYY